MIINAKYLFENHPMLVWDENNNIWVKGVYGNRSSYHKPPRCLKRFLNGSTPSVRYNRNVIVSIKQLREQSIAINKKINLYETM